MKASIVAVLVSLASSAPVLAGTFVYVSNAEDGDMGMYTLQADGSLQPGPRFKANKLVMPMAVSPDKRFLIAAVRSKPFQAYSYSIDKSSGALNLVGTGTLAESCPYIALDRSGRFLLGASYGANQVGVNPVGADGRVGEPLQVIPTARNAHSIRTDIANRFVFVPHLGTDQVFQFVFDEKTGRLTANTPPVLQLKQGTGPAPHAEWPPALRRGAHVEHARRLPGRYRDREADLSRQHADRETAPRVQHRSERPLRGRVRRTVGYDLVLCDRCRDRHAET